MKIKPGYGYWETDRYPIGGCFRRAGENGVEIVEVTDRFSSTLNGAYGCNMSGMTSDGRRVAFSSENTE